jgi:hypothetical protein
MNSNTTEMKKLNLNIYPALRLALALTFVLSFGFAQAQDDEDSKAAKVSGGYGYFVAGATMLESGPMNNYLSNYGFGEYNGTRLTFGGGGIMIVRNFILGGEGHSLMGQDLNSPTQDLSIKGGWGQFSLGYVLLGKKGMLLYPKVGVGGYNHRLTVTDANQQAAVDDVFYSGNYSGTELIKTGLLLSGSMNFEFMPGFDQTAGSGLVFGIEAGYNYAATDNDWTAYEANLAGGPALNMTGAFARLRIGFGGWHRQ